MLLTISAASHVPHHYTLAQRCTLIQGADLGAPRLLINVLYILTDPAVVALQHCLSTAAAMLRHFTTQLLLQHMSQTCRCTCASAAAVLPSQLQSTAPYSSKLNPKEHKRQQKSDRRKAKQDQQPSAAAADSTSFAEEGQAVEADVTKLVLQVDSITGAVCVGHDCRTNHGFSPSLVSPHACEAELPMSAAALRESQPAGAVLLSMSQSIKKWRKQQTRDNPWYSQQLFCSFTPWAEHTPSSSSGSSPLAVSL